MRSDATHALSPCALLARESDPVLELTGGQSTSLIKDLLIANPTAGVKRYTSPNSGRYFTRPRRPPSAPGFSSATMNTSSGTGYSQRKPF